jgi:hypothetical protein
MAAVEESASVLRVAACGYMQTHETLVNELALLRAEGANLTKYDHIKNFVLQREAQAVTGPDMRWFSFLEFKNGWLTRPPAL